MKKALRKILGKLGLYAFAIGIENKIITLFSKKERKSFYKHFLKEGDLCFDVGANLGNRTVIFLELGAKVVAVEPQKECYEYLSKRFGNKIELVKYGLGEKESVEKLYVSDLSAISSFSKEHVEVMQEERFKGVNWDNSIDIQMTTLDHLIEKYGVPQFCKIDVEGYEYDVLKGLSKPLKTLSLEYIVPENLPILINCIEHLSNLGTIECNYSAAEKMNFALPNWISGNEMITHIQSKEFIDTSWGDVYIQFV
ncbi:MAG: FkbM family methyltransferase [Vicingus serpentipes]|nr:FkbM family methyltransferase [Vicingus serpentipes]